MKNAMWAAFRKLQQAGEGPCLTKPQWDELEACARKPQNTFGSPRARKQNTLKKQGLCEDVEIDGLSYCQATATGRDALIRAGVKL